MAKLFYTDAAGREQTVLVREGDAPAIVGRNPGCAIQTNNPSVSRNHVKIGYEGGQVVIKDLGSSNGTFFRIEGEMSVPAHSLLLMGQQLFRLEY